jgi:hypothetical protein
MVMVHHLFWYRAGCGEDLPTLRPLRADAHAIARPRAAVAARAFARDIKFERQL